MQFIAEHQLQEESMAELSRKYGISRKTAYKWLARWRQEGPGGLADRSRAPKTHPNRVPDDWVELILALRDRYGWGPKKLLVLLRRQSPELVWPAISTIEQVLRDHSRIIPRKKRLRVPPQTLPLAHATGPNAVWCVDFKGHFLTGDGSRCHPLTVSDAHSRFLLRCQGLKRSTYTAVRPIFEWTFREYGLPWAIRSDNGTPFASRTVGGLSRLSVWWMKLGIQPDRIEPGHPEQNGRHERMHLTLKQETASPPASTFRQQQGRFDNFQREFNEVRPHEALTMRTPASVYENSPRQYPREEPPVIYPDEWTVRKVDSGGYFYWKQQHVFVSELLAEEPVGLEPVDGRYWRVYFGPMWVGAFDSHHRKMLAARQVSRRPMLRPRVAEEHPSATLQDAPLQV
jgi:transposase InsO family protein